MWDWLFDSGVFMTRDRCGPGWTPSLILVNQVANFLIFLAYASIPFSLVVLWTDLRGLRLRHRLLRQIEDLSRRNKWVLLLFAVFILSCGLTHLNDVIAFQSAPYRYFTAMDLVTAVTSLPTAILLPRVARRLLAGLTEAGDGPGPQAIR